MKQNTQEKIKSIKIKLMKLIEMSHLKRGKILAKRVEEFCYFHHKERESETSGCKFRLEKLIMRHLIGE